MGGRTTHDGRTDGRIHSSLTVRVLNPSMRCPGILS